LLFEIAAASLGKPFIVTCVYDKGTFTDDVQLSILHYPCESTDYNVFHFELSPDGQSVDLVREELEIR
jgi:hypothetical protein